MRRQEAAEVGRREKVVVEGIDPWLAMQNQRGMEEGGLFARVAAGRLAAQRNATSSTRQPILLGQHSTRSLHLRGTYAGMLLLLAQLWGWKGLKRHQEDFLRGICAVKCLAMLPQNAELEMLPSLLLVNSLYPAPPCPH